MIRVGVFGLAIALSACVSGSAGRRDGWPSDQVQALSPELREAYAIFAARCSRCHTLSRPLASGISDLEHWQRYIARMRRMPGSGISRADARKILAFLEHQASLVERKRAQKGWLGARFDANPVVTASAAEAAP